MTDKNILIIDHNIIRFHHIDLMESFLHHRPIFDQLKPENKFYLNLTHRDKILFFNTQNVHINIMNLFTNKTPPTMTDYSYMLNRMIEFNHRYTATTGFGKNIELITNVNMNKIFILKFTGDVYISEYGKNSDIIYRDNILDPEIILAIIKEKNIGAIIMDNIDIALYIAEKTSRMTFMIKPYPYNLTRTGRILHYRKPELIDKYTKSGHSFISIN